MFVLSRKNIGILQIVFLTMIPLIGKTKTIEGQLKRLGSSFNQDLFIKNIDGELVKICSSEGVKSLEKLISFSLSMEITEQRGEWSL